MISICGVAFSSGMIVLQKLPWLRSNALAYAFQLRYSWGVLLAKEAGSFLIRGMIRGEGEKKTLSDTHVADEGQSNGS